MSRYMKHVLWMIVRPIVHPFWRLRQQSVQQREAELALYEREREAALNELKIELLLAHRQGVVEQEAREEQWGD